MKMGLALISYVYNADRVEIVKRTLPSLARTNTDGLGKPVLDISCGKPDDVYETFREALGSKFELRLLEDPPGIPKPDQGHQVATAAASRLLDSYDDVTHVACLVDDYIYNPEWLHQLHALIERHPTNTRAWSVFRSRYTAFHQIIGGDGIDVLMTMHDSMGCMTREEMRELCTGGWPWAPDCAHANHFHGDRWATSRDYMENLGRHHNLGIGDVDCAIDFVGEE